MATTLNETRERLSKALQPGLRRLGNWWEERAPSERRILLLLGFVLVVFILYSLLWQPMLTARNQARSDYVAARQTYNWMAANASAIDAVRGHSQGAVSANNHWVRNINQSAAAAGLALKGFTPQGNQSVRVALEAQPFANVMQWFSQLRQQAGVAPASVVISASNSPGRVNVQVTLTGGQ